MTKITQNTWSNAISSESAYALIVVSYTSTMENGNGVCPTKALCNKLLNLYDSTKLAACCYY